MPKDDYFVIAYRLLKYLYDCRKKSRRPGREVLDPDFFQIDNGYWEYILRNLFADGYVEGIDVIQICGKPDPGVKILSNFGIMPKGIQYLSENSMFAKIKGAVKDIAEMIPII